LRKALFRAGTGSGLVAGLLGCRLPQGRAYGSFGGTRYGDMVGKWQDLAVGGRRELRAKTI